MAGEVLTANVGKKVLFRGTLAAVVWRNFVPPPSPLPLLGARHTPPATAVITMPIISIHLLYGNHHAGCKKPQDNGDKENTITLNLSQQCRHNSDRRTLRAFIFGRCVAN